MANNTKLSSSLGTAYLAAYNAVQFLGWAGLLITALYYLVEERTHVGLYGHSSTLLQILQTAALLEIAHAAVGLVKSNPIITGVQIFSRVFIVWGILHVVHDSRDSLGYIMLLLAWSITEAVRYPFYLCQLIGDMPYALKWARYTFFFVLYPIGVTGELLSIYSALPYVRHTGLFSLALPNKLNISFNYYYYLLFLVFMYIPIFPQLYLHMISQRKKVLSRPLKCD